MAETVTVSNLIAIASLVSEIWLAINGQTETGIQIHDIASSMLTFSKL